MTASLVKANQRIRELCGIVNGFSERAGLGKKVRAEDYEVDVPAMPEKMDANGVLDLLKVPHMLFAARKTDKDGTISMTGWFDDFEYEVSVRAKLLTDEPKQTVKRERKKDAPVDVAVVHHGPTKLRNWDVTVRALGPRPYNEPEVETFTRAAATGPLAIKKMRDEIRDAGRTRHDGKLEYRVKLSKEQDPDWKLS